jgi:hypothetical protein
MTLRQEKVENTKVVMISRKSKKDRQSNGQNEKNNNTINALCNGTSTLLAKNCYLLIFPMEGSD